MSGNSGSSGLVHGSHSSLVGISSIGESLGGGSCSNLLALEGISSGGKEVLSGIVGLLSGVSEPLSFSDSGSSFLVSSISGGLGPGDSSVSCLLGCSLGLLSFIEGVSSRFEGSSSGSLGGFSTIPLPGGLL